MEWQRGTFLQQTSLPKLNKLAGKLLLFLCGKVFVSDSEGEKCFP